MIFRLDDGTTAKELACGAYDTDVIKPDDEFADADVLIKGKKIFFKFVISMRLAGCHSPIEVL